VLYPFRQRSISMVLRDFESPPDLDRWTIPYFLQPDARKILIVGAGGGKDVAAAIAASVEKVVAVPSS